MKKKKQTVTEEARDKKINRGRNGKKRKKKGNK